MAKSSSSPPPASPAQDDKVMNHDHALELLHGLAKFQDGRHSDFTVTCGARAWKVHKFLLSAISPVLEKSCFGRFKESVESSLNLSLYAQSAVEALIAYIYTGAYTTGSDHTDSPLAFHVKMSALGDYFAIAGLEGLANSQFKQMITDASIEQVIEAAAVTATSPRSTKVIENAIVDYATRFEDLYTGDDCLFSRIAAVNAVLGMEIAKEERAIAKRVRMMDSGMTEAEAVAVWPKGYAKGYKKRAREYI